MDKDKTLDDIFNDDPLGLLNVKPKVSSARNADERLVASFHEIIDFYEKNNKEPEPNSKNISEYLLYSRLKNLREDENKKLALEPEDKYRLLQIEKKEIKDFDDILGDDMFSVLDDNSEGLFEFKHAPKEFDRANTDFVARRKPCPDFENFESMLKEVQKDLVSGKRKLIPFKEDNLREGELYVHNGVLFYLAEVDFTKEEKYFPGGKRDRKDGRTRCIFENGTESNMLYRSVAKALYTNGKVVTQNIDKVNEEFFEKFGNITDEDKEAGYIYVLSSKSTDEKISTLNNLFKIGYSKIDVQERVKNAEKEPTYLMAPVRIEGAWKCFNMNPQKFEQLIHNFFGNSCLEIDVFDEKGKRHTPREWFIIPYDVIEQAIQLIISGEIVNYRYSLEDRLILKRQ